MISIQFLVACLLGLAFVVQASQNSPDNNSPHWSLRSNHQDSNSDLSRILARLDSLEAELQRVDTLEATVQQQEAELKRVDTLEAAVQQQASTILDLQSKLDKADTLHRFLQSSDEDCLPKYVDTVNGPRCDFLWVTRFQNKTFFNGDAVFNENVEFDLDADCMPLYNSTTKQCHIYNNYTFNEEVELRNKTRFTGDGDVKVKKDFTMEGDVYIRNDHKDIEFVVDDRVRVKFQPDYTVHFYKETTFHKDVEMEKSLDVAGDLDVDGHTTLDHTDIHGDLDVDGYIEAHGRIYANDGITAKDGIVIKTGKLDIKHGGAHIYGDSTFENDVYIKGELVLYGDKVFDGDVIVKGKFTAKNGAVIEGLLDPVLYVDGQSVFRDNMDVNKKITAGALYLDGDGYGTDTPLLTVAGDGKFNGKVFAADFLGHPITPAPTPVPAVTVDIDIDTLILAISERTLIVKNLFINTEDKANEVLTDARLQNMQVKTVSVETNTLMVEETAMVGADEILTTADAALMESSASASAPAGCGCTESDITGMMKNTNIEFSSVLADSYKIWKTDSEGNRYQESLSSGGGGGSCTCEDSQIQSVVTKAYVDSLGVSCDCPESLESASIPAEPSGCGCSTEDIRGAINQDFVRGFVDAEYIDGAVTCECTPMSNEDIENVVNGMDLGSGGCDCPDPVTESEVKGWAEDAVNGMDLDSGGCDCPDPVTESEVEGWAESAAESYVDSQGFISSCTCEVCDCPTE